MTGSGVDCVRNYEQRLFSFLSGNSGGGILPPLQQCMVCCASIQAKGLVMVILVFPIPQFSLNVSVVAVVCG